jgi:hypothetical protein
MNALAVAALLASPSASTEEGLVAHFRLDEGEGMVVRDVSGSGLRGEIQGAIWREHGEGYLLAFDGEDDYVKCEPDPALDQRGPMTLSAWIWPEEVPGGEVGIAGKQFTSYLLTYYRDRKCWWYIGMGGNNANSTVAPGTWSHVAGTFDGSTLRLYVNGRPAFERPSRFDATPAGKAFFIGCVIGDPEAEDPAYTHSGYFKGMIADVRVYSRALSAEEILAQFDAEVKPRLAVLTAECRRLRSGKRITGDGEQGTVPRDGRFAPSLGQSRTAGNISVRVARSGAMQIGAEGGYCLAESAYSFPGESIGWHRLGGGEDLGWAPEVERVGKSEMRIRAAGEHYSLERTVRIDGGRVEVEDRLWNRGDEPVGILMRHALVTPHLPTDTRLGIGAEDSICFAAQPGLDLGIVVEDDIGRAQFAPFCTANRIGFRTDRFALEAGSEHTFRWAVYPLAPTGDAMALVNRVRCDWDAN